MTEREERNKKLIEKYPFLSYKEYDFDNDVYYMPENYDYNFTWFDEIPDGWAKAFGEQLCEELKKALDECNYTDKYNIVQIKEKFGELRIYDGGIPKGCRAWDVIEHFSHLSSRTCISCGKPATKISLGWICPWCDDCAKEINSQFASIDKE